MKRLGVWVVQSVFFPGYRRPPAPGWEDVIGGWGAWQRLSISRRGRELAAIQIRASGGPGPRPQALLIHPRSARGKMFFIRCQRARYHLAAGCDVVMLDLNGFGESERIDLDYAGDVAAAARALSEEAPVIVHGVSFGSYQVALALPDLPPGAAVILENCSRSFYDGWKHWLLPRLGARLLQTCWPGWAERFDAQRVLRESERSDLLLVGIGGGEDRLTPAEDQRELIECFPHRRALHVIERADHLEAPMVDPVAYRAALAEAWQHVGLREVTRGERH